MVLDQKKASFITPSSPSPVQSVGGRANTVGRTVTCQEVPQTELGCCVEVLGQAPSLCQTQDERHMVEGPALPAPILSGPQAAARPGKPSGDGALQSCARVRA